MSALDERRGHRLRRYLDIVRLLAYREFAGRFRGNWSGGLTIVLLPLAMLLVYTFVFTRVIPVRLGTAETSGHYAFFLFSGLLVWNTFADSVSRSSGVFRGGAQFLRRPGFPKSALQVANVTASVYQFLAWLGVYAVARWWVEGDWPWTLWLTPLAVVPAAAIAAGVSLALGTLAVYVRDVEEVLPPVLAMTFFLSPILYPLEHLSEISPWLVQLNPIALVVSIVRDLSFVGRVPSLDLVGASVAWAAGALLVGSFLYRRLESQLGERA